LIARWNARPSLQAAVGVQNFCTELRKVFLNFAIQFGFAARKRLIARRKDLPSLQRSGWCTAMLYRTMAIRIPQDALLLSSDTRNLEKCGARPGRRISRG
jgi:hypothetical protein